MEENSELEEGEAHCYKDDEPNIETDLSYIDEKVQNILGHHRKDFEGEFSKDILGAKFGGYGSFLPTHERSLSNCAHAKTPQSDSNTLISQCNLSSEGTSQKFQPISNVSLRTLGTVSYSDRTLQNSGLSSGDFPLKHDFQLSSARVAEKFNTKDGSLCRSGNLTDQRTLRLRIKVKPNKTACSMAVNSGLRLDKSTSSSMGNIAEEGGGKNSVSQETADESPTRILLAMTSLSVPGGVLISPLHDSLLCLIRKERLSKDSEHVPSTKGSQEHSAMSTGKSDASLANRKLLREKRVNFLGKGTRPVQKKTGPNEKDENNTSFLKKKIENGKEMSHNNVSRLSLCNSECFLNSAKEMGRASKVSSGADKDEVSHRLFSSNLVREDSSKSIPVKDSGKRKRNCISRLVEKVSEQRGTIPHHEVLGCLGESDREKGRKIPAIIKPPSGPSKCNSDPLVPSKQKIGNKSCVQVKDEIQFFPERKKQLYEGKKSKGSGEEITSYGASTCKSKMQKLKSQKYINKARVVRRDPLNTNLEQVNDQLERPSNKPSKKVDSQVMHESSIKDTSFLVPSTIEGKLDTVMVSAEGEPNDKWVCCDNCEKWRLLPFDMITEHLPDKWMCSMQNWLPGMNQCDISEEVTNRAFYALCQLPAIERQNNVQNYANGPSSVITLDHGLHLDKKHQCPDSTAVSIQAKKRNALNRLAKAGDIGGIQISNTTKSHLQDSVNRRSLIDKNQSPAESNVVKILRSRKSMKSCNSGLGDSKKLKTKKRRNADQYGCGSSKKAKIEDMHAADRHRDFVVARGMVAVKPNAVLQTEAGEKNILNELSDSEDAKCADTKEMAQIHRKKLGDQARVSSDVGSLDVRMEAKRNNSRTKRKWQDNQNGHESMEYAKEESGEVGREKKSRVQKTVGRDFSANTSNNMVVSWFPTRGSVVDSMGHVGSVDNKCLKNRRHGRDFGSQHASNTLESVSRDFGSVGVSMAASSSSSKVPGSCKYTNFEEVIGSPIESVSSSPLRTSYSYPDKLTSAAKDSLGKDGGGTDCVLVNNHCERKMPSDGRMPKQVIERELRNSGVKLHASIGRQGVSQQNWIQDLDGEVKANQLDRETINGMSKLHSSESKHGQRTAGCRLDRESQQGEINNGSCGADVSKASKYLGNVGNKNEFSLSLGNHSPDVQGIKDLNAPISGSMKSYSQDATAAFEEAKKHRDYADRHKSSVFDFKRNEAYFQSALKIFLGASLLETCNSGESRRNGEMTQIEAYGSAAQLWEFCGNDYERCQEMAAAALAYKCMEVAYMRAIYCKQSSISRDLTELQATLHMTAQGESPSSSASDVDNLNNQMTAEKATLSKGMVSHAPRNHVVGAPKHTNIIGQLDFVRDAALAMEASRKSQDAFAALKEGQSSECITIIKKVIDFSFHEVEEFLSLVRLARESIINRSGYRVSRGNLTL